MTALSSVSKASLPVRGLHWLMALLIICAWGFIYSKGFFAKGSATRAAMEYNHIVAGLLIFALIPLRMVVRWLSPLPEIRPLPARWQVMLAKIMHVLMYVGMIVLPILGVLFLQARGKTVDLFGLTLPTLIDTDKTLSRSLKDLHESIGLGMLYLASVHAVAALMHHIFYRDNTLRRML